MYLSPVILIKKKKAVFWFTLTIRNLYEQEHCKSNKYGNILM